MQRALILAVVCSAVLAAQSESTTVYFSLGENAKSVENWDGSVRVSGGNLVRLEGRHFMGSDRLQGTTGWRASTRQEQIQGFPRVNYNEMSPAELPPTQFSPIGIFAVTSGDSASFRVRTKQGQISFSLSELANGPKGYLDGRAVIGLTPTVEKLSTEEYEDDEPTVTQVQEGVPAVVWVAYKDQGDSVMVRIHRDGAWEEAQEVTPGPSDIWRASAASDGRGRLWVFWSQRNGTSWDLWGRMLAGGSWGEPQRISAGGWNTFHRAASTTDGEVVVVWQSSQGDTGQAQSDIWMRVWNGSSWGDAIRVSDSPANDWEPHVASGAEGQVHIVWDGYHNGNYDIFYRHYAGGSLGYVEQVTRSPRFQAHANVAVDPEGTPWIAWDESGPNWGKDQGYLVTPPLGIPLHQERSIQIVKRAGDSWSQPKVDLEPFYTYRLYPNFESPQIAFDRNGTLTMLFRHWTRQRAHSIGSRMMWETFLTRFDGDAWTTPVPLSNSQGTIEKRPSIASVGGSLFAAWMTDNRLFSDAVPKNADIYVADLGGTGAPSDYSEGKFTEYVEPFVEEVPIHPDEERNVATVRGYTIDAGDRQFRIFRGDMHRHTDVSQDFKYDGSLIEVYRYALDAAAFDYIVPTDHQLGYDQEFTWWQDEKLTDLFHVPGTFVPMFGYERSLPYPNGHRNVIFAKRGTRTLPIPDDERRGEVRAENLYAYLHENDGISMPHSSGTAQGTDWFNNDPEVEPLMEIFQGYRASYEYMGAPLAASPEKLREQRSGFNPIGYWWDALKKGYKIGVQASSDHWSTHMSYAMIVAEEFTRDSMFAALKARHAYAATDNIVLDFQAQDAEGRRHIMGDIMSSETAPRLFVRAVGSDRIKQFVVVKNQQIIYTSHPNSEEYTFEYTDRNFEAGSNYYYVRVVQSDGQVAWSSPIWVE